MNSKMVQHIPIGLPQRLVISFFVVINVFKLNSQHSHKFADDWHYNKEKAQLFRNVKWWQPPF